MTTPLADRIRYLVDEAGVTWEGQELDAEGWARVAHEMGFTDAEGLDWALDWILGGGYPFVPQWMGDIDHV